MIIIRKSHERGKTHTDWLNSLHTFSFASYYDPHFMGFGNLRVINEDTVKQGMGFGKHSHQDMEIISYVIEGEIVHQDSLGTGSAIKPGEIQRMSAGTGILHSEFNASKIDSLHFLQIWIIPEEMGLQPSYEQKTISKSNNQLILIGSREGRDGSLTIHQHVDLYVAYLLSNAHINYPVKTTHKLWLQVVKGQINVNGNQLSAGDGAVIEDENSIEIKARDTAEILLFDFA